MTRAIEQVVERVSKLPVKEQDELALRWLAELDDDRAWDERFEASKPSHGKLADWARRQAAQGDALHKGIDEL